MPPRHPRIPPSLLSQRFAFRMLAVQSRILPVLCWSGICRLGSIQIGSLGLINTLPFDHESGSPESLLGLRPDINKPPLQRLAMSLVRESLWSDGCLFGRSQKEDSPSLTTAAHEQERGCPGFLCEPLLCKTLRQGGQ